MGNANVGSRTWLYDFEDTLRSVVKELATSSVPVARRLKKVKNNLMVLDRNGIPDRLRGRFDDIMNSLQSLNCPCKEPSLIISQVVDLWADVLQSVKVSATRWHHNPTNFVLRPLKKRPSSVRVTKRTVSFESGVGSGD